MMTFPGEAVAASRVLVVGDVMLDRYWFGDVDRISPEAPVPVVKMGRVEDRLGGAANVARNCAALGAKVSLLSVVGADDAGRTWLVGVLQGYGDGDRYHATWYRHPLAWDGNSPTPGRAAGVDQRNEPQWLRRQRLQPGAHRQ